MHNPTITDLNFAGEGSSPSRVHPLSLREIASWTPGVCEEVQGAITASVPALQRGLVWNPQQNELLWDSILRGFPIGALVVTRWSQRLKKTSEGVNGYTHHLLDGQQRCNAIAMGYADPFSEKKSTAWNKFEPILWLDLEPDPNSQRNSTRNFWVRSTTLAHPWGYSRNDATSPLSAESIRKALNRLSMNPSDETYQRPSPVELWPAVDSANTPVPLSWLLQLTLSDEVNFWEALAVRSASKTNCQWSKKVHQFCINPDASAIKSRIFKGIKRAQTAGVIALEAPDELLDISAQEKNKGAAHEDVSNIEQLFQRLNQQGTKLDGEELSYSMIKAYWPDLEQPINKVSEGKMPQARMVSLGIRAALANAAKQNLPSQQTVSQVRAIARDDPEKKDRIQNFISKDLGRASERVGLWLKYHAIDNSAGLLPVHITSIAVGSREVYLLLLHFASRMEGVENPQNWCKTMQALASIIHWFGIDKAKVTNRLFSSCLEDFSLKGIGDSIKLSIEEGELSMIHTPESVDAFLQLDKSDFKDWNWRSPIHGDGNEEDVQWRQWQWQEFLNFRFNRELLLYAQRGFLNRKFSDYNPARKDLWEAHNRPWDFDHILAAKYLHNRKDRGPFKSVCDKWCNTIGNFRAWPFEDNRSDKALSAREKLSVEGSLVESLLEDSFITPDEVDGFSGGDSVRDKEEAAWLFAGTCRMRLLRIYKSWYDSMQIVQLIAPHHSLEE